MRLIYISLGFAPWTILATTPLSHPCDKSDFSTVHTSNGPIRGHQAETLTCVLEYLGIPYAKPPVGHLRFAPPLKIDITNYHNAERFGFDCPLTPPGPANYPGLTTQAQQILNQFSADGGNPQSEDCLTLNIWSKVTPRSAAAQKPVLVFFHGGRFTVGTTNSPFYTGKYFAEAHDIVVVTVNYRLNIFGFPGAPGEPQNLGLRDQRAALEWIQENIHSFGGNYQMITISGQSSGGLAVDALAYVEDYIEDPPFNGIIAHSGNVFSFPSNTQQTTEKNWDLVVEAVGCKLSKNKMACMRESKWDDIKKAAATIKPSQSSSVLRGIPPFYPTPDNITIFSDYTLRTKARLFAKVPVLFGNNHQEDGFYRIAAFRNGIIPTEEQTRLFMLETFTCPVTFQADARRNHHVPSWTYRFLADWQNTRLYNSSGAYHGVELHMIFGASEDVSSFPASTEQIALMKVMQGAWSAFADDPWDGLSELGWPRFDPQDETLVLLGKDNSPKVQFVSPSVYDASCSTVTMAALGTSPTMSSDGK